MADKEIKIVGTSRGWVVQRPDGTSVSDADGNKCFAEYVDALVLFVNERVPKAADENRIFDLLSQD